MWKAVQGKQRQFIVRNLAVARLHSCRKMLEVVCMRGGKLNHLQLRELFVSVYRCNNVLYIRGVEEEEEDGEMRE